MFGNIGKLRFALLERGHAPIKVAFNDGREPRMEDPILLFRNEDHCDGIFAVIFRVRSDQHKIFAIKFSKHLPFDLLTSEPPVLAAFP
jgi:hypothetical protein